MFGLDHFRLCQRQDLCCHGSVIVLKIVEAAQGGREAVDLFLLVSVCFFPETMNAETR